jgi:hypothetical protein
MIVKPPFPSNVWNVTGTLGGNTVGASTYSGTNVVFYASDGITLQGSSDSIYFYGGAGGPGGGIAISAGTTKQATGTVSFADSNGVSWGMNAGTLTASVATNYLLSTRSQSLNEIQNPAADALMFMNTRQLQLQWGSNFTTFVTAGSRQGLVELDFAGPYTDTANRVDVLHIHQSVNDPPIHLVHIEAAGTNPLPLHITAAGASAMMINRPIYYTGGSVPMVLGSSQSNMVSFLNANYLQGHQSSEFTAAGGGGYAEALGYAGI